MNEKPILWIIVHSIIYFFITLICYIIINLPELRILLSSTSMGNGFVVLDIINIITHPITLFNLGHQVSLIVSVILSIGASGIEFYIKNESSTIMLPDKFLKMMTIAALIVINSFIFIISNSLGSGLDNGIGKMTNEEYQRITVYRDNAEYFDADNQKSYIKELNRKYNIKVPSNIDSMTEEELASYIKEECSYILDLSKKNK